MKTKLNYFAFILLLVIVIGSFFFVLVEPHSMVDYNITMEEFKEKEPFDMNDPDKVSNYILSKNERLQSNFPNLREKNQLTENQIFLILDSTQTSLSRLQEYGQTGGDPEYINLSLYFSLWEIQKAVFLNEYYQFNNCVNDTLLLVNNYYPLFFFLKYEDLQKTTELKEQLERFTDNLIVLEERPDNVDNLISESEFLYKRTHILEKSNSQCQPFYVYISKDYKYQRLLLKVKIILLLLSAVFIFILGKVVTWKGIKKIISEGFEFTKGTIQGVKKGLMPKLVKEETIKTIVKLGSLVTTMASIIALFTTVLGIRSWGFISIPLLCVISLLFGIISGIISLNNPKNHMLRKLSYYSFLIGMALFILFILEIILVISLASLFTSIKESISLALTNSTQI